MARRTKHKTWLWPVITASVLLAGGAGGAAWWYSAAQQQRTFDAINRRLDERLADKYDGGDPRFRPIAPEDKAFLASLRRGEDPWRDLRMAVLERDFVVADLKLRELRPLTQGHLGDDSAVERRFRFLTLEGDRYFLEGKYAAAAEPWTEARELRNTDASALLNLALSLMHIRGGDERSRLDRATALLREALRQTDEKSRPAAALKYNLAVVTLRRSGDVEAARDEGIALLRAALASGHVTDVLEWSATQRTLAEALTLRNSELAGDIKEAAALIHACAEKIKLEDHPREWCLVQTLRGRIMGSTARDAAALQQALDIFDNVAKAAEKHQIPDAAADAHRWIAVVLSQVPAAPPAQLRLALARADRAMKLFDAGSNIVDQARMLMLMGSIAQGIADAPSIDRFKQAAYWYDRAAALLDPRQHLKEWFTARLNCSVILEQLGAVNVAYFDEAARQLDELLKVVTPTTDLKLWSQAKLRYAYLLSTRQHADHNIAHFAALALGHAQDVLSRVTSADGHDYIAARRAEAAVYTEMAHLRKSYARQAVAIRRELLKRGDLEPAEKVQEMIGIAATLPIADGDLEVNTREAAAVFEAAAKLVDLKTTPGLYALVHANWADTLLQMPTTDGRARLLRAIELYHEALKAGAATDAPRWIQTHDRLADAYLTLLPENRAKYAPLILRHTQAPLEILTKENAPLRWAAQQIRLAAYYLNGIGGHAEGDLEKALEHTLLAGEVIDRNTHPRDWAQVNSTLGVIYLNLKTGDRAENLQRSIAAYRGALEVLGPEFAPDEFTACTRRLGDALLARPGIDDTQKLRDALAAIETSAERARKTPKVWAKLQLDLAVLYTAGPLLAEHGRHKAIAARTEALRHVAWQEDADTWAQLQSGLSQDYMAIRAENPAEYERRALQANQALLDILAPRTTVWGNVMMNHGLLHRQLSTGDRAENLKRALRFLEQASEGLTVTADRQGWARVQMHVASTALELATLTRDAAGFSRAESAADSALSVLKSGESPLEWSLAMTTRAAARVLRPSGVSAGARQAMLDAAVRELRAALPRITREVSAADHAVGHAAMAQALMEMQTGERAARLREALSHCDAALAVFTPETAAARHEELRRLRAAIEAEMGR